MKTIAFVVAVVLVQLPAAWSQDKSDSNPLPLDKWNLKAMTEKFSLEAKSLILNKLGQFVFVLEFTKDIDNPKELGQALSASPKNNGPVFDFLLFDADNVILAKKRGVGIDGEITGRAGDAFRLSVSFNPTDRDIAKKAECRLSK